MDNKRTFNTILLALVVILMMLPFVTTFNEFLTRIVENSMLYRPIEKFVVPYEVALVRTIISLFGIQTASGGVAVVKNGVNLGTFISWNCIGWQSFIILLLSLKVGFAGNFTKTSRIHVALIGLICTFFINVFRISFVLILLYYLGRLPATLFHDYATVFISIIWLFFFWWFSYSFVLEER